MHPLERIRFRSEALRVAGRWREPAEESAEDGVLDTRSNDYLGLARWVVSRETLAAADGLRERGAAPPRVGAGASRLVSGTWKQHTELEARLAQWVGHESALLFSSAYAANIGVLGALAGPGEVILSDALNHASIIDGCRLSKAEVIVLPHASTAALERALANTGGVRWVVTESYFGMDGDVPDLARIRALCDAHGAGLIVDEAHALGVFGPTGSGLCGEAGMRADVLVGGMGKAAGIQGGFAACARELREWLWNRARSFGFSTAPSPVLCDLTLCQLERVREAEPERARLRGLERRLERALAEAGVPLPGSRRGPIFPIVFGDEASVLAAAQQLLMLGVRCQPIRPPTVPVGGSRLRVTLRSDMSPEDVDRIGGALANVWSARARALSGFDGVEGPGVEGGARPGLDGGGAEGGPVLSGSLAAALERRGAAGTAAATSAPAVSLASAGAVTGSSEAAAFHGGGQWVVLGTGTGVGKTFVSRGLVSLLAAKGVPVAGIKPIETGVRDGVQVETDGATLRSGSFHVKHPAPHPLYCFPDPLTPSLAARRAGRGIDLARIPPWLATTVNESSALRPHLVIETAGGVFSPLTDAESNFDLARLLDPACWILVAPDRLGVLHDTVACLHAMAALNRRPDWIVLSAPETPDPSTGTNAAELRRHPLAPTIIELPRNATEPLLVILQLLGGPANRPSV